MLINRRLCMAWIAMSAGMVLPNPAQASDADEARAVVDKARLAFNEVVRQKDFESLREGLKTAKGVLIYPEILKAGFFLGGSGGTGVLLVRGPNNDWSDPAFYTVGSVSFGLQFGGQKTSVVILINSQTGIDGLMTNAVKLGADVSVAAGPIGAGQAANLKADFVSYSKAKGAFLGFSLEGSVLDVRGSLNNAYYSREATPIDIVSKRAVSNKRSLPLRKALAAASR